MTDILKTRNYFMFTRHENNKRDLDEPNIKKITASITKHNLLEFKPILVDKDMKVLDGMHRLEVAKNLSIYIYYQVKMDGSALDILSLNSNQKKWDRDDYIKYHASLGNKNYQKIIDFSKEQKMSLVDVTKLINGSKKGMLNKIESGEFVFPSGNDLLQIQELIEYINKALDIMHRYVVHENRTFLSSRRMKLALAGFLVDEEVNKDVFIRKLASKADLVRPCLNVVNYYNMFKSIYNYQNRNPIIKEIKGRMAGD